MIYLDHHACAPLTEAAREAMSEARRRAWANPSSAHRAGRAARAVVERAREQVAAAIGAAPADVVFTAGGTEACNLAVLGVLGAAVAAEAPGAFTQIVTTSVEHPAIEAAVEALAERLGASCVITRLPVPSGRPPSASELERALGASPGRALVVLGWVNHEVGTRFPIEEYAAVARAHRAPIVVDGTQALGKVPVDVGELGVTALALAASKIGGPPSAGALWIARDADVAPRALGGGQERGRRGGTADAAALAGFGAVAAEVSERLVAQPVIGELRDLLEGALVRGGARINGDAGPRASTVTSVSVPGWRGPNLVAALDLEGLCASSGAACSSGTNAPSPVILAMHPSEPERARSALRLSLGPSTTRAEVVEAMEILGRVLSRKSRDAAR